MRNAITNLIAAVTLIAAPAWAQVGPNTAASAPVGDEPIIAVCAGDFDGDGVVDSRDLSDLLVSYGKCRNCIEDINGDSVVGDADLEALLDNWGACQTEPRLGAQRERLDLGAESEDADLFGDQQEPGETDCPSDLDGDGSVDATDLGIMLTRFGECKICVGDLDGDHAITERDIRRLMADWGDCDETEPELGVRHAGATTSAHEPELSDGRDDDPRERDDGPEVTCEGDINGDGFVDSTDLGSVLASFGKCRGCDADLNGDDVIDNTDVNIVLRRWGSC